MQQTSTDLQQILTTGAYTAQLVADVLYDEEFKLQALPVVGWKLQQDLEAQSKMVGELTVAYAGDSGDSLSPAGFLDRLAPYGQTINLRLDVAVGDFTESIDLGRHRITAIPAAGDSYLQFAGGTYVTGSVVTVTIRDLLVQVARNGFHGPQPPVEVTSTWQELQRITGLPILRTVPDKPTPAVVYEPKDGGRLTAVQGLASYLGGVATITVDGELSIIPFTPGPVVAAVRLGPGTSTDDGGTVFDITSSMDSEQLFNEVAGVYQGSDGTPWYGYAAVTSGPLNIDGPFGRYTYYDSAQDIESQGAANARARQVLERLLLAQAHQVKVTILPRPDLELGDVIRVDMPAGPPIIGRVLAQDLEGSGPTDTQPAALTHTVTLDLARAL